MHKCNFFFQRHYGGDPFSNYVISYDDVKEFFVKIMFNEDVWEERMKEDAPFDNEDLHIDKVDTTGNGALVYFHCAQWVLLAMKERYEVEGIRIDGIHYTRRLLRGGDVQKMWSYVTDEGPYSTSFFKHLQPLLVR
jgi:hypothetical protein